MTKTQSRSLIALYKNNAKDKKMSYELRNARNRKENIEFDKMLKEFMKKKSVMLSNGSIQTLMELAVEYKNLHDRMRHIEYELKDRALYHVYFGYNGYNEFLKATRGRTNGLFDDELRRIEKEAKKRVNEKYQFPDWDEYHEQMILNMDDTEKVKSLWEEFVKKYDEFVNSVTDDESLEYHLE
ncbi:MAG: hypothetical protein JRJ78_14185 [Deltaproteobacteria bacterium]|nr:hypothetical protein [Deltaproteobacteria bacterium]